MSVCFRARQVERGRTPLTITAHYTSINLNKLLWVHLSTGTAQRHSLVAKPRKRFCQILVGLTRFELVTPRLSSVCSNQLSYRPAVFSSSARQRRAILTKNRCRFSQNWIVQASTNNPECQIDLRMSSRRKNHSRKEVIQPQVLLQLPCYDFTPITDHTLGASPPCGLM